jgi:hypothetical protein
MLVLSSSSYITVSLHSFISDIIMSTLHVPHLVLFKLFALENLGSFPLPDEHLTPSSIQHIIERVGLFPFPIIFMVL